MAKRHIGPKGKRLRTPFQQGMPAAAPANENWPEIISPPSPAVVLTPYPAEPNVGPLFPPPKPNVPTSPGGTIANMHDLAVLVFAGYPSEVPSIAVAEIVNLRPVLPPGVGTTWLVAIPGTNADTSANYVNAIASSFQLPTSYLRDIVTGIVSNVPPGTDKFDTRLYVAGHSQGGMVAQALQTYLTPYKMRVSLVTGFGSPHVYPRSSGADHVFFRASYDPVPGLSPANLLYKGGWAAFLSQSPPQIQIDGGADSFNPIQVHNSYATAPDLLNYDVYGRKLVYIDGKPYVEKGGNLTEPFVWLLGPITRFQGPALPG